MKILGIGTDIVDINRIKNIIKKNADFKKRIFSKNEIQFCKKKRNNYSCLAKRFAKSSAGSLVKKEVWANDNFSVCSMMAF